MPRRPRRSSRLARLAALVAALPLLAACSSAADLASGDGTESPSGSSGSPAESPSAAGTAAASESPTAPSSPSGPASPSDDPKAAPKQGDCRALSADDLTTVVDQTQPVSCEKTHTAVTFFVGELPPSAVRGATSSGDDRIEQTAEQLCAKRFPGYVGGSADDRALTMLQPAYFLPDAEQFRSGARWVRCDLYAHESGNKLAELTGDMRNALRQPKVRNQFAICSTKAPDQRGFTHSLCGDPHKWRAVSTLRLGKDKAKYPGENELRARAKKDCEEPVRDWLNTREAFSYGFEVPRKSGWAQGERIGYCWAKTTT